MKICFLSSMHTPRDKRVFNKEAVSLAQAGYSVVHLAPGLEKCTREQGVEIVTYPPPRGLLGRLFQIPRLYWSATRIDADCYHCNEVDSWFVGVLLKLTHRKKVVFDVHEHYPSTFAEGRFPLWLRPLVAGAVRLVFRALIPFTDRFVFAKKSVASDFSGAEEKQVLVQNFTSLAYLNLERQAETDSKLGDSRATITAIHLGLISRLREWPELLEALARAKSKNLRLCIVGTFNDGSREEFEKRVTELALDERVDVEGWMPFEQAYRRILASDIGLVLFRPDIQNHLYALPHKMFDYMLAGLPVIAPVFAKDVAPIIRGVDCGILVDPSRPDEIANALDRLVSDGHERRRLGENGRRAVIERYNWESEAPKLLHMYRELLGNVQ